MRKEGRARDNCGGEADDEERLELLLDMVDEMLDREIEERRERLVYYLKLRI